MMMALHDSTLVVNKMSYVYTDVKLLHVGLFSYGKNFFGHNGGGGGF
jgi:hypothetical protein